MKYKIQLTKKSKKEFLFLERDVQKKITDKFRFYILTGKPLKYAKKLKDPSLGTYRFRIGDYRAIFDIDKNGKIHILLILKVGHRKNIY